MTAAESRRDARERTVDALVASYHGQARSTDLLEAWQSKSPMSPTDAGLALELTLGVARRRITCEHIAALFFRGRWAGLRDRLRVIIAVGVYQLCWLDRIPDHAAIDQAVRQAKKLGIGAAKTANAVLRQVQRHRGERGPRTEAFDPRKTLLLDDERQVVFTADIFPDPGRKPLAYYEAAYGQPAWLIERWHRVYKPAGCRQICEAGLVRPHLTLRPNTLKTSAPDLIARLAVRGLTGRLSDDGASVHLESDVSAARVPEIAEGLCQPQDETAQLPLRRAVLLPGMFVVDYCAGVGTKSTQAAELMCNQGRIIATDIDDRKLESLDRVTARRGISIIESCAIDEVEARIRSADRPPDVILIDAPCLNTGVLARRPEARYRASQAALRELSSVQADILRRMAALAGRETRLIYTTCSIERDENEDQVAAFMNDHPEWAVMDATFTLPDPDRGGGYYAILSRLKIERRDR